MGRERVKPSRPADEAQGGELVLERGKTRGEGPKLEIAAGLDPDGRVLARPVAGQIAGKNTGGRSESRGPADGGELGPPRARGGGRVHLHRRGVGAPPQFCRSLERDQEAPPQGGRELAVSVDEADAALAALDLPR